MEVDQIIQLVEYLFTVENVLGGLGLFSILAKITPWDWDDDLAYKMKNKPHLAQNVVKWTLKVINLFGLSKKF